MDNTSSLFNGVDEKEEKAPDDTEYPICGICGEPHESSDCDVVGLKTTINDTPVLSKARLSLPAHLKLVAMADGSHSVVTIALIVKGTRFGPYEAKEQFTISPTVNLPLKVFKSADDNYFKEYYLNTTNEFECNWMYFVNKASNLEEQNLICFQDHGQIFYISVRDINIGEHLHVWYAPYYGKLMKMGSFYDVVEEAKDAVAASTIDVNELIKRQHKLRDRKTWNCKFCGKHEDNIQAFALHISEHYTAQLRKTCEICKERFFTQQSLKKHMLLSHNESITQNKVTVEVQNKQSTNSNQEHLLGPLLTESSSENNAPNVLLEHVYVQDTSSIMANETLTLNVENIEDENFNFEIPKEIAKESEKEKHVCDICLKQFTRLKFLIIHLNAHTGKYACKQCLTVFTRNENFVAHKCLNNTSTTENKCTLCSQVFTLNKYLKRHMIQKHGHGFVCSKQCRRVFGSQKTLEAHSCDGNKNNNKAPATTTTVTCHLCSKEFGNNRNLRRHLKTHDNNKKVVVSYICEVCSKQFQSKKGLKQHLNSHKPDEFPCKICDKTFTRRSSFMQHMDIHRSTSPHVCTICNAKFTLKKYLTNHLMLHTDELKYKCNECPQRFRHKVNLTKHYNNAHVKTCKDCTLKFSTVDEYKAHLMSMHLEKTYECPVCKIRVKLRSSLKRHVKQKHGQGEYDMSKLDQYIVAESNKKKEAKVVKVVTVVKTVAKTPAPKTVTSSETEASSTQVSVVIAEETQVLPAEAQVPSDDAAIGPSEAAAEDMSVEEIVENENEPDVVDAVNDEMINHCLLQVNNAEVMNELDNSLQLDEIVNVLGGKSADVSENVLDYGSIEMEFENNYGNKNDINIAEVYDGNTVCLSMPELNEQGQAVTLGDNIHSSFILENASLNGPVEQVVLYILDQKPS